MVNTITNFNTYKTLDDFITNCNLTGWFEENMGDDNLQDEYMYNLPTLLANNNDLSKALSDYIDYLEDEGIKIEKYNVTDFVNMIVDWYESGDSWIQEECIGESLYEYEHFIKSDSYKNSLKTLESSYDPDDSDTWKAEEVINEAKSRKRYYEEALGDYKVFKNKYEAMYKLAKSYVGDFTYIPYESKEKAPFCYANKMYLNIDTKKMKVWFSKKIGKDVSIVFAPYRYLPKYFNDLIKDLEVKTEIYKILNGVTKSTENLERIISDYFDDKIDTILEMNGTDISIDMPEEMPEGCTIILINDYNTNNISLKDAFNDFLEQVHFEYNDNNTIIIFNHYTNNLKKDVYIDFLNLIIRGYDDIVDWYSDLNNDNSMINYMWYILHDKPLPHDKIEKIEEEGDGIERDDLMFNYDDYDKLKYFVKLYKHIYRKAKKALKNYI